MMTATAEISESEGNSHSFCFKKERMKRSFPTSNSRKVCFVIGYGAILAQMKARRLAVSVEGDIGRSFVVENSRNCFLTSAFFWRKSRFESAHLFWGTMAEIDRFLNLYGINECYLHLVTKMEGKLKKQKTLRRFGPGKYQIIQE